MIRLLLLLTGFLLAEKNQPALYGNEGMTPEEYEKQLESGIDAFYRTDWMKAEAVFDELKQQNPDDPRPHFFEAMMPFWEYFLVESDADLADAFLHKSETAVELSEKKLEISPGDTTMVLLLSGLHGYRGLVAADQGRYKIALESGITGFNYTRKLLSLDPDRPDTRIGRGMFFYMVGSVPGGMKWVTNLMGFKADIEDGFQELEKAANTDSYLRNDALVMLMYLHEKEEKYPEALEYAEKLTNSLPDNVIFQFKKAKILEKTGNNRDAVNVYNTIVGKNNPCLGRVIQKSKENIAELKKREQKSSI